jgi:hypothetical protein
MTMSDYSTLVPEEILRRIRDEVNRAKTSRVPKTYHPPVPEDFAPGVQILCFDQSLSNSGWALVNTDDGKITIPDSGTIRPPRFSDGIKGFASTLTKSVVLAREIQVVLSRLYGRYEAVVIELPSIFGYRTESSLVAAATICIELDRSGEEQPILVSRNSAGAVLCADRNAPKTVSSALVNELVVDRPTGLGQWTEHVRDAVFVGLRHLHQGE